MKNHQILIKFLSQNIKQILRLVKVNCLLNQNRRNSTIFIKKTLLNEFQFLLFKKIIIFLTILLKTSWFFQKLIDFLLDIH